MPFMFDQERARELLEQIHHSILVVQQRFQGGREKCWLFHDPKSVEMAARMGA